MGHSKGGKATQSKSPKHNPSAIHGANAALNRRLMQPISTFHPIAEPLHRSKSTQCISGNKPVGTSPAPQSRTDIPFQRPTEVSSLQTVIERSEQRCQGRRQNSTTHASHTSRIGKHSGGDPTRHRHNGRKIHQRGSEKL